MTTTTDQVVRPTVERGHALTLLAEMLRVRRFEEKAAELYSLGKIRGFLAVHAHGSVEVIRERLTGKQ
jgi:TPP-dependent pyruvate/acetoin dehydrogenase alpha subunit